jgi:hypothetical protein
MTAEPKVTRPQGAEMNESDVQRYRVVLNMFDSFHTEVVLAFAHDATVSRLNAELAEAKELYAKEAHAKMIVWEEHSAALAQVKAMREALLAAYRHMQSTGAHESYLTTQRALLEAAGYRFDDKGYYICEAALAAGGEK